MDDLEKYRELGRQIAEAWITLTPDYTQCSINGESIRDFLETHKLEFSHENLDLAWDKIKKERNLGRFEILTEYDREFLKSCGIAL